MLSKVLAGYVRGDEIAAQLFRHHDGNARTMRARNASYFLVFRADVNAVEEPAPARNRNAVSNQRLACQREQIFSRKALAASTRWDCT
jgi:hypothetical protein